MKQDLYYVASVYKETSFTIRFNKKKNKREWYLAIMDAWNSLFRAQSRRIIDNVF